MYFARSAGRGRTSPRNRRRAPETSQWQRAAGVAGPRNRPMARRPGAAQVNGSEGTNSATATSFPKCLLAANGRASESVSLNKKHIRTTQKSRRVDLSLVLSRARSGYSSRVAFKDIETCPICVAFREMRNNKPIIRQCFCPAARYLRQGSKTV